MTAEIPDIDSLEEARLRAAERMLIDGGVDPKIVQRVCRRGR